MRRHVRLAFRVFTPLRPVSRVHFMCVVHKQSDVRSMLNVGHFMKIDFIEKIRIL